MQALAIARADLQTARRRVARGEERLARWEALLSDPAEMARRRPKDVVEGLKEVARFTREWTRRVAEVQRVIERLKERTRIKDRVSEKSRQRTKVKSARTAARAAEALG